MLNDYLNYDIKPSTDFADFDGFNEDLVVEDYKDLAKELICIICQQIVYKPTSCKTCQNLFCQKCIDKWLLSNYQKKCPFKCSSYVNQEIPKSTRNLINKIKLKCSKYDVGCTETIFYENYENHYRKCSFIKFKCIFCDFLGSLEKSKEHYEKICPKSIIECNFCGMTYKKNIPHDDISCKIKLFEKLTQKEDEIKKLKAENKGLEKELRNYKFPENELSDITEQLSL
jgi:hypothetical protein